MATTRAMLVEITEGDGSVRETCTSVIARYEVLYGRFPFAFRETGRECECNYCDPDKESA